MQSPWHRFREQAGHAPKRILLADGEDSRVIKAAAIASKERIAQPILIGSKAKLISEWRRWASDDPACLDPTALSTNEKQTFMDELRGIAKFRALTDSEV